MQYVERLTTPLRWWVQGTMLVVSLWLAVIVALPPFAAWLVAALALSVMIGLLVSYGSARIRVTDDELWAGRARIETRWLRDPEPLDAESTRRVLGVDADTRAHLVTRPYLKQAVRVWLTDPDDPVPYWVISTRHPRSLATALDRAVAHRSG